MSDTTKDGWVSYFSTLRVEYTQGRSTIVSHPRFGECTVYLNGEVLPDCVKANMATGEAVVIEGTKDDQAIYGKRKGKIEVKDRDGYLADYMPGERPVTVAPVVKAPKARGAAV